MAITLQTVSSGYNLSAINANFQSLQSALNDAVLWRKGNVAGETLMERDLDMNGHAILNIDVNFDNPSSLLTLGVADLRYYNVAGDALEGDMDAAQHRIKNLPTPVGEFDALRKRELDLEQAARVAADENLQAQLNGTSPPMGSAFSVISWHAQRVSNSVVIPSNVNAWSFGPTMQIDAGQSVTIGSGSYWTVANGQVNN